MIRSWKSQLSLLAWGPESDFHSYVKARLGKKATEITESKIRAMILLMPGLAERISHYLRLPGVPPSVKKAGAFLLIYLYHPKDFLPECEHGLFGYIDDAYFTAVVYEDLINKMRKARCCPARKDVDILKILPDFKKTIRRVIPEEAQGIERMYQDIKNGSVESFFEIFNLEETARAS